MRDPPKRLRAARILALPFLGLSVYQTIEGAWLASFAFAVLALVAYLAPWVRRGRVKVAPGEVEAAWELSDPQTGGGDHEDEKSA